jgi:hypothetical protein
VLLADRQPLQAACRALRAGVWVVSGRGERVACLLHPLDGSWLSHCLCPMIGQGIHQRRDPSHGPLVGVTSHTSAVLGKDMWLAVCCCAGCAAAAAVLGHVTVNGG